MTSKRRPHTDIAELEQRVLAAAKQELPPPELTRRMARGVATAVGGGFWVGRHEAAQGQPLAPDASASSTAGGERSSTADNATSGSGPTHGAPTQDLGLTSTTASVSGGWSSWFIGTAVVAALGAGALGSMSDAVENSSAAIESNPSQPPVVPAESPPLPEPYAPAVTSASAPASATAPPPSARKPSLEEQPPERRADRSYVNALRAEISIIDAARGELRAGSAQRALVLVNEYAAHYPNGSFQPEAAAMRIEALVKVGRKAEARTLAEHFVAKRAGTPLAERVGRLTGLTSD